MVPRIYHDMRLYVTPTRFYIAPDDADEFVIIERLDEVITIAKTGKETLPTHGYEVHYICGVIGMVRLTGGLYLIVATVRKCVGQIENEPIWQLAAFELYPLSPTLTHLSEEQKEQNSMYISMIRSVLETPAFYFSYGYDLTNSLQRSRGDKKGAGDPAVSNVTHPYSDERFLWNGGLLEYLVKPNLERYIIPLIHGFVSIKEAIPDNQKLVWVLISRRSVEHAGTRLFCRGINKSGEVANFVETEQLLVSENDLVSFVQTRGSIPLYWNQMPNLQYKPRPQLKGGSDHVVACERHFEEQERRYGAQVLINLIDHKGAEDVLEKAFDSTVASLENPKITYVSFDFHQECKKMRYGRLSVLLERIEEFQEKFGVFHIASNGKVHSVQKGVFRTNCIDCLDRTNVVQSLIARRSLAESIEQLGFSRSQIVLNPQFDCTFKAVWADNADFISVQYSGTGALKTDFTRTGKRTFKGLLDDGMNSMTRYIKNNFFDGYRQDSIELFLGQYRVPEGEGSVFPSPLDRKNRRNDIRKSLMAGTFLFEIALVFIVLLYPAEFSFKTVGALFACGGLAYLTIWYIRKNWNDFIDWPKLLPKN